MPSAGWWRSSASASRRKRPSAARRRSPWANPSARGRRRSPSRRSSGPCPISRKSAGTLPIPPPFPSPPPSVAFTVIRSGSIWYAVGFHALFNYAAMYLYGAPNSGNDGRPIPTRLITGGYHGAGWLTVGKLGMEASWLVFPVIAALFLGYHFVTRKTASSATALGYNPPHPA